jgi:putative membrane protein insertion efficiency factor
MTDGDGRPGRRRVDRAVVLAIRGYRRISPRLPTRCRYEPTCSAYGLEAVRRYGSAKGLRLTAGRLVRCRPGVRLGTLDPVP